MFIHRETRRQRQQATLPSLLARHDLGAGAVEFALIIPFLLMLAGGIVEMANLYFVRSQLNEIVRDATRRLAVDAFSEDEARKFIRDQLSQTTDAEGEINVAETKEQGDEATDVTVSISVPLKDILIFDVLADIFVGSDKGSSDLSVSVTMFKH